jgi:RimJ/RimL family protein N-acetyltransferase
LTEIASIGSFNLAHWSPPPLPARQALEGRFCSLEPLDPARHGDALFSAVSGPDAARLHQWLPENAPESRQQFDTWLNNSEASNDPLFFAVIDKRTGLVGGRQTLMRITPKDGVIEIGNILWGPSIAGTPVATEALFLFADHVFSLGYRRFEWKCNNANEPSKRAALRFGFTFEGIFRQHMIVKGINRDTAWYAMLDHEWQHLRTGYRAWLAADNFDQHGQQRRKLADFLAAARLS